MSRFVILILLCIYNSQPVLGETTPVNPSADFNISDATRQALVWLSEARKAADEIKDPTTKASVLELIISSYVFTGDISTAESLESQYKIDSTHNAYCKALYLAEHGNIQLALEKAVEIDKNEVLYSTTFARMARAIYKSGKLKEAFQIAAQSGDDYAESCALNELVNLMIESGDLSGAQKTAARIKDVNQKAYSFSDLAKSYLLSGKAQWGKECFQQALRVAEETKDVIWIARIYNEVARDQIESGDLEAAKETVRRQAVVVPEVQDDLEMDYALSSLAINYAGIGHMKTAFSTAEKIDCPVHYAQALWHMYKFEQKRDPQADMKPYIDRLDWWDDSRDIFQHYYMNLKIEQGDYESAILAAEANPDKDERGIELILVATDIFDAGKIEQSLELLKKAEALIWFNKKVDSLYSGAAIVTRAWAYVGKIGDANRTAASLKTPEARADAYASAADGLMERVSNENRPNRNTK